MSKIGHLESPNLKKGVTIAQSYGKTLNTKKKIFK
jgi:hypothetical protein